MQWTNLLLQGKVFFFQPNDDELNKQQSQLPIIKVFSTSS